MQKPRTEKHALPVPPDAVERFEATCKAGALRHGVLWLRANQAAVSACMGQGFHMEHSAAKLLISTVVLRVLDAARPDKPTKGE